MDIYQNSPKHIENAKKARLIATEINKQNRFKRIEKYNLNPNCCNQCGKPIDYERKYNTFCSKSCSATHNNNIREISPSIYGHKISTTLKEKHRLKLIKKPSSNNKVSKVEFKYCTVCNTVFYTRSWSNPKKTCSKQCQIHASIMNRKYPNVKKKHFTIVNIFNNQEILLDSSWEFIIATFLNENNIIWERPQPIPWIDSNLISHLYFPDFYLPVYNLYLDPKNPYCLEQDKEKLDYISTKIDIIYGDYKKLLDYLNRIESPM